MKTDLNGCSTTVNGQEQYEDYFSELSKAWRVQYDYRTPEGKLFSCVAIDLEAARAKRDAWIEKQKVPQS